MPTYTTNYSIPKPTNNGDATTWGTYLNSGMDIIDTTVKSVSVVANAALPLAGGTLTGGLTGTTANFSGYVSVPGNIISGGAATAFTMAGGNTYRDGGYIGLYGSSAVGVPGTIQFGGGTGAGANTSFGSFNASGTFTVLAGVTVGGAIGVGGNATVTGTLGVTGATTFTGVATFNGGLNSTTGGFSGAISATSGTFSSTISAIGATFTGPLSGTAATFSGLTTASGGLVIGSNVTTASNGSAFTIAGGATYNNGGSISLYGSSAAGSPGTIQFAGGTGVTSTSFGSFAANGTFGVVNNATVGGTLGVTGVLTATGGVVGNLTGTASTATNQSGGTLNATSGTVSGALSVGSLSGTGLASAAQTLTGSSTTQAITPAGFSGNSSIAANGYYKLPGGLVIAWGSVATAGAGTTSATFPYTFTNVFSVQGTEVGTGGGAAAGPAIYNVTTTGCQFVVNPGASVTSVYFVVIGN